jgi:hypothetical protein
VVRQTLGAHAEPEVDCWLVAGAIVAKDGSHYRIESGDESWDEIEALARRQSGVCDCGKPLSSRGEIYLCRTCGREFQLA